MARIVAGATVGKYQIVELLGRGGMAEVYKAYHPGLDRYVAIKFLHEFLADEEGFLTRFKREATAVGRLRHPNIVQVHDFDVIDETYYMVMEFVDGATLKAWLEELTARGELLPSGEVLRINRAIASALAYAHRRGMIHRDVKPANVMIDREGQVILTDFGIAKMVSTTTRYTATGGMLGTPTHIAPEQARGGGGDARSDLYSLGAILFQMVTGQLPYDADTPLAMVLKHVTEPLPIPSTLNPAVDPALERVILKAMAKNADDRFQTGEELIAHLDAIKAGKPLPIEAPDLTVIAGSTEAVPPEQTVAAGTGDATLLKETVITTDRAESSPTILRPDAALGLDGVTPVDRPVRRRWILPAAGAGALVVLLATLGIIFGLNNSRQAPAPAVADAQPLLVATTAAPSPTATATTAPAPTEDVAGTAVARVNATLTAQALLAITHTPSATPMAATPTPVQTSSPAPTPTVACIHDYEVVAFFTYNDPSTYNVARNQTSAPASSRAPLTIQLTNTGTCPWPIDCRLRLVEGNPLGYAETLALKSEHAAGETAAFDTVIQSGSTLSLVISLWRLELPDGTEINEPFELRVLVYEQPTPTPAVTPTPAAPTATPTSASAGPVDFHWSVGSCEYLGTEWQCLLTLQPYGGVGEPYTVWIYDSEPPARYFGSEASPVKHWLRSRRCFAWVNLVKVQDDAGNYKNQDLYVDPNAYFPGGCTLP